MSLDTDQRIIRNAQEVIELLTGPADDVRAGVSMPFYIALDIHSKLEGIILMAKEIRHALKADRQAALDVVEGLLAGWRHTEVIEHYRPPDNPGHSVLMKDEALRRASLALKLGYFSTE